MHAMSLEPIPVGGTEERSAMGVDVDLDVDLDGDDDVDGDDLL